MPPPRNPPTRSSQRRNSQQDDMPVRTRAGRGGKSAPSKPDRPEIVLPKPSPTKLSPTITRKTTRSASNISGNSFEAAPEIYASYEDPLLMVFGLSPEFFNSLRKHHGKLPKERKVIVSSLPLNSPTSEDSEEESESDEESVQESDQDVPIVVQSAPRGGGRGRGSRGGRGGRGRGGRGRGRGRGRGGVARTMSPAQARPPRNAANPMFPLAEDNDEVPSNQATPDNKAWQQRSDSSSPFDFSPASFDSRSEAVDDDDESDNGRRDLTAEEKSTLDRIIAYEENRAPTSVADSIVETIPVPTAVVKRPIPKILLPIQSTVQTPKSSASTPAESALPKLLDPEDDTLSDSDLPEPFIEDAPSPIEAECEDRADYLLQTRFKPMADVQAVIASLTKYPVSQRSTENLFALAENTQIMLKAWQDEYITLDTRTAPHMHPPKKACNGGRIPLPTEIYEDLLEADLYSYIYDPKKPPGCQDPWAQRPGAEKSGGRELRTRRARDLLDSAAPSEEDEEEDNEGRPTKRQRKATRKFDGTDTGTGTNTPKKHNGWGGARKKGVSRFAMPVSETPEPEGKATKPARITASNLLHQRIQEMREESIGGSSGEEGSSAMDVDDYSDTNPKRGRPAGSKNTARRSDFGVKKGPRKKTSDAGTPAPSAHGPNVPPPALNSMMEGQGQFTVAPPASAHGPFPTPDSAGMVFQSTPQNHASQERLLVHPNESSTPEAYMTTAPLSQYTGNYADESTPPSGSRRKPRVKSEKRSQSMTIWWAERKARKKEADEKNAPPESPTSRQNSLTLKTGIHPGGYSAGPTLQPAPAPAPAPSDQRQHSPTPLSQHAQHLPQDTYAIHAAPGPFSAPVQHYMYPSAPPQPHPMILQYPPLAAVSTGPYSSYSGLPPPSATSQYGPRALAPAPVSLQHPPTYPSPYGPQSPAGSRPKSSGTQLSRTGPPPLAPAPPQQYSPYGPNRADRPSQVMIPGSAPADVRRGSR